MLVLTLAATAGGGEHSGDELQAAVDGVARRGGGTVRLGLGTWRIAKPITVPLGVQIIGSGCGTVLTPTEDFDGPMVSQA